MSSQIYFFQALHDALAEEMRQKEEVIVLGECVPAGDCNFWVTAGLIDEFGPERVWDTPLAENAIIGLSLGAALTGLRPVPEIMMGDFVTYAMDMICNEAAKWRYLFGGNYSVPMTIRVGGCGAARRDEGGYGLGAQHSQNLEAWFCHVPGLKVVYPSTPFDAKGLLKSAIRANDPILFFEHKGLYPLKGVVPETEYTIPLGSADVKRPGDDITIIAWAMMLHKALDAAAFLEKGGISVEVIDPRTLYPLDMKTILDSVKKTGHLLIVEEAPKTGGVGAEISASVSEAIFQFLKSPIRRIAAPDTPVPASAVLEEGWIPKTSDIVVAVKKLLREPSDEYL